MSDLPFEICDLRCRRAALLLRAPLDQYTLLISTAESGLKIFRSDAVELFTLRVSISEHPPGTSDLLIANDPRECDTREHGRPGRATWIYRMRALVEPFHRAAGSKRDRRAEHRYPCYSTVGLPVHLLK
jgi:hypothetical protein